MIDLRNIDIIAVTSAETTLKRTASTEGGNYAGKCPKCGDKDDFIVLPEHVGMDGIRRGQFFCRECHPKRGDTIEYLQWCREMSYKEAIEFLHEQYNLELPENWNKGGRPSKIIQVPAMPSYRVKPLPLSASAPSQVWQARAKLALEHAQKYLMDEKIGKEAREYLHSRGLTDETMRHEGLGFNPEDIYDDPLKWGLNPEDVEKVFIPRGIIFPYQYKGDLWKLRIRRIEDGLPKDKRYMMVSGSSNGLYRADSIKSGAVVALFEGEIDALSAAQSLGLSNDEFVCVATGSTSHARIPKWSMLINRAPHCLLCFDADGAGAEARNYWIERMSNASSLAVLPGRKDANDMLTSGDDLCAWLVDALLRIDEKLRPSVRPVVRPRETCETSPVSTSDPLPCVEAELEEWKCAVCGLDLYSVDTSSFSEDGRSFCDINPETKEAYCSRQERRYEGFMKFVNTVSDIFGGCTITHIPQGYTLSDHVAYLKEQRRSATPSEVELKIMSRLKGFGLFLDAPCPCGCRLWWESAGSVVCARCEPGGLWSDISLSLLNGRYHHSSKKFIDSIPQWLIPDTRDWDKQVERNGAQEMRERRSAWFAQHEEIRQSA